MAEPRVPGRREPFRLACGEAVHPHELDLGMREFACPCGAQHGVVMDVHPPERFLPSFLVDTLKESVEVVDEFEEFGTPHLMGLVLEEFPDEVVAHDASDDGYVGYAVVWVTEFSSRRLHEVIVELVIEFMEHAVSHTDERALGEFEEAMVAFDVAAFVEEYREERDLSAEDVPGWE